MEHNSLRKRKKLEEDADSLPISLDEMNQDLLERILSWLPPSSFFRLRSVCKGWNSVATSATFQIACSRVPAREPWLFMVSSDFFGSIVYDTSEGNWKDLKRPGLLKETCDLKAIPVASSGGLVCFQAASGSFVVCNPVTGACRKLSSPDPVNESQTIHAIAMNSTSKDAHSYKLVMVSGEFPDLTVNVYDSTKDCWEEVIVARSPSNSVESEIIGDETMYFLSKAGDVVVTNMQRSPWKQFSSVMTVEGGEEVIYFLSPSGSIVACNLSQRSFYKYPRLLPIYLEHSLDVVESNGEMFVVILSDFLESASLRVWKFSKKDQSWHQAAAMPPAMSHDFYGKKADINCVAFGDMIFVCVNSSKSNGYFACNLTKDEWVGLPKCVLDGKARDFMSAFSFEPRLEACV